MSQLAKVQEPFLEAYWQTGSYPTRVSFNGKDETPFPKDDLVHLYDLARRSCRSVEKKYYKPLLDVLDPVRGILRSHPSLSRALGTLAGNDEFHVRILNGTSLTWLTQIVAGLLERADEHGDGGIVRAADELGSLLELNLTTLAVDVPSGLDQGYDLLLFHGPEIRNEFEVREGLIVKPAAELSDYLDREWIRDFVPDEMDKRDWRQIGAVVQPFRWRPSFRRKTDFREEPPNWPARFEDDALTFLEILSVANQTPVLPFALIHECVHRSACGLLGLAHSHGGLQPVRQVGRRHDPFRTPPQLQTNSIDLAKQAYENRKDEEFERLAPIIHRLSEALARVGRFGANDRVLDISQSLELMFKPKGAGISRQLQDGMADLLGIDEPHKDEIRAAIKQVYDVRSAIVHGATDARRKRHLEGRQKAFVSGFNLTQQALFKMIVGDT
ncbi:HEPN domain-containing protein [Pseudohalocynthiibacter sp. F2068]|uniref:HEPN domain-containing protein n=1 Tax=Pseudohalocynthiibacter sp. F2068 TaxID=2926418 RepID=UPI001FF53D8C|nr:HEPN domain-containing protein [Pseudohalocynthiibacter sp. F2068]